MEFVSAALIVLIAVMLLGLLLILGVVRRLRDLTERIGRLEAGGAGAGPHVDALAGEPVGDFTARSDDGAEVSQEWLTGSDCAVAFLTYGCSACKVQLPVLRDYAAAGRRVLAVVALVPGEQPDPAQLRGALGDGPVIVEEEFGGPVQLAFGVDKYPTFYLVGADQTLRASAAGMRDLVRFQDRRQSAGVR